MLISPDGVPVSDGGVGEVSVSRNCGGDIFQSQGHVRAKKNSRSWFDKRPDTAVAFFSTFVGY